MSDVARFCLAFSPLQRKREKKEEKERIEKEGKAVRRQARWKKVREDHFFLRSILVSRTILRLSRASFMLV